MSLQITEKILHYIWQYQLYNKKELKTVEGNSLDVLSPGSWNHNQGPDFLSGRIRLDEMLWVGSIEIHVKSSDWKLHGHDGDVNYKNVVLHVVWEHDQQLENDFQTLELQHHVPKILLKKFDEMKAHCRFIPCENLIGSIPPLTIEKCKENMMIERLIEKSAWIIQELRKYQGDWEIICMLMLARCFGGKVNAEAFEEVIRSIPPGLIRKLRHQPFSLDALLFGQSGLLSSSYQDQYPRALEKEYQYMSQKYGLLPISISMLHLRMRPGSFPCLRLSQLSKFIMRHEALMSLFISAENFEDMRELFVVDAGHYWNNHYRFDEISVLKLKQVGEQSINHIMVNAVIPMIYAYGSYNSIEQLKEKALDWMGMTKPESNGIIHEFKQYIPVTTAYDSQALLQLKKRYCDEKKCMSCIIGNTIFSNAA